ncbi:hypothetical protein HET69_26385 [Streptomyces sp. CJ_13]|uniref:hypothetical protein n=1 Tax=unclassified Streptomyces TaxID=2593676 RepID=UPI00017E943C|nr:MULTISPECIES: hypothetical protein [unclassified Streptomyces]EDX21290.1 hypothetical protein SSAG_01081 [Streptomyces sp. Mg1]MBT1187429.1 hypothetical protein [Streptomyces sp. CJ_13]RPK44892.1 hypothetical protein EES37_16020 [Streptomyces sp. ADI91-18]
MLYPCLAICGELDHPGLRPRPDGSWFEYPLEAPQSGDVVVRQTAAAAVGELERLLSLA